MQRARRLLKRNGRNIRTLPQSLYLGEGLLGDLIARAVMLTALRAALMTQPSERLSKRRQLRDPQLLVTQQQHTPLVWSHLQAELCDRSLWLPTTLNF